MLRLRAQPFVRRTINFPFVQVLVFVLTLSAQLANRTSCASTRIASESAESKDVGRQRAPANLKVKTQHKPHGSELKTSNQPRTNPRTSKLIHAIDGLFAAISVEGGMSLVLQDLAKAGSDLNHIFQRNNEFIAISPEQNTLINQLMLIEKVVEGLKLESHDRQELASSIQLAVLKKLEESRIAERTRRESRRVEQTKRAPWVKINAGVRFNDFIFSNSDAQILTLVGPKLQAWDLMTGDPVGKAQERAYRSERIFQSADGSKIFFRDSGAEGVSVSSTGEVRISAAVAAVSPDSKLIATVEKDGKANSRVVQLWDADSGILKATLEGHTKDVLHVAFSEDGNKIVTSSKDGLAIIWDSQTPKNNRALIGVESPIKPVVRALFSPDRKWVITLPEPLLNTSRSPWLWNAVTGKPIREMDEIRGPIVDAQFNQQGSKLLVQYRIEGPKVWDFELDKIITDSPPLVVLPSGKIVDPGPARFTPGGNFLVTNPQPQTIEFSSLDRLFKTSFQLIGQGTVGSLEISPDGKFLAVSYRDSTELHVINLVEMIRQGLLPSEIIDPLR